MMKASVTRAWKSLTSKLHPPQIASPRESQRLFYLLNTSFKQQLDREHSANPSSNEHYANFHLKSILTDPLFKANPRTRASSSNKSQSGGKHLGQLQDYMKRPTDAFKEQVSRGVADLRSAKIFLGIQYKDCLASPGNTPREAMQSSGTASTITQWLWSSGMEDKGTFLQDPEFVAYMVPFLIAEGQHSRILSWLNRCNKGKAPPFTGLASLDPHRLKSHLFNRLIAAEIEHGDGLESAITLFIRTVASLRSSQSTKVYSVKYAPMSAAWGLTTYMLGLPKAAQPEYSIVEPFLEAMRYLNADLLLNATLCVYFEKCPDPQPALTYLQIMPAAAIVKMSAGRKTHIVLLGLRAAELFLQNGRQNEAIWIMEFVQTNFALEVGLPPTQARKVFLAKIPKEITERELYSLLLLDTLEVQ